MKTYVYEDTEVKLTGRVAERKVSTVPNKPPRIFKLVEITPVHDFDWKKWVPIDNLYEIKDNDE